MKRDFQVGDFVWFEGRPDMCGFVIRVTDDPDDLTYYEPRSRVEFRLRDHPGFILHALPKELEWSLLIQLAWESRD